MLQQARGSRKRWLRRHRVGVVAVAAIVVLLGAYAAVLEASRPHVGGDRLRFDSLISMATQGRLKTARVLDEDAYVVGQYVDEAGRITTYNAPLVSGSQQSVLDVLVRSGVPIEVDQQVGKRVVSLASFLLPGLIVAVVFVYFIVSFRRGTGLFGVRSGARRIGPAEGGVTFADVAGQDGAVEALREITAFLSEPDRFAAVGAQVPKGVLLYGPPGCGKTLLARALAAESGASFFSISGSDFVELYAGVGASRVRDLFRQARDNAPAVIFIDELDSLGRSRVGGRGMPATHGEQEQALNQALAEMDGFSPTDGIIVVAATNRPDVLDAALLRPGRFDRTIALEPPDETARAAILAVHARTKRLAAGVDLRSIASKAIGLTGADLANLLNEAALLAVRGGRAEITQDDLDATLAQLLREPERQRRLSMRERAIGTRAAGDQRLTFADVAGVDDAVEELAEVRDYLTRPARFAEMGARLPRGILLAGPPGCGKTRLARALAGEANAAFLAVAGSEFVEVFAGEGASRVRELFAEARLLSPAIVFIDEIDAVGARRGVSAEGHREREQTLNQILVELDGFDGSSGVVVMAATNRPDILDPALVRPGRFDRQVSIDLPDQRGREAILALHARDKPLGPDVDLAIVAKLCRGFSGADLANVLNEAALLATRKELGAIPMALVEEGVDRATLGVARGTVLSADERRIVAYHESGHALVALALPHVTVPHKLSIVSRGPALGRCTMLDTHEQVIRSRSTLLDVVAVVMAGRAAEQVVFGEAGTAVANDIQVATTMVRRMVCELGMSEELGAVAYADVGVPSEHEAGVVAREVRRLLLEAEERASVVLAERRAALDRIAANLLERETLTASELANLAT